jgi:hypothetical protein
MGPISNQTKRNSVKIGGRTKLYVFDRFLQSNSFSPATLRISPFFAQPKFQVVFGMIFVKLEVSVIQNHA